MKDKQLSAYISSISLNGITTLKNFPCYTGVVSNEMRGYVIY